MGNIAFDQETYSAMQAGKPLKTFRKTILGRAHVYVLNPFSGLKESLILQGDAEQSKVDLWSLPEVAFFMKMNAILLKEGSLIEVPQPKTEPVHVRTITEFNDAELEEVLNYKFLKLQNEVSKTTSVAVIYRLLNLARDGGRSEKLIKFLEGRLSELQFPEPKRETEPQQEG